MKIKFFVFCFFLIFSLCPAYNFARSEYQQVLTSQGKVIIGLNREEAIERFGPPASATEEIWHYIYPQEFFVYLPSETILLIRLYPEYCEIPLGYPMEFKALAYLSNFKIKDITSGVELSINKPQNFVLKKPGVIIPKEAGEYQILAKYRNIFSNSSYLTVKAPEERKLTEKEQLLNIDILPYRPKVFPRSKLGFFALGTFFQPDKNIYIVREIGDEVMWFTERDGRIINEKDKQIYFPSLGKVKVFSKFRDFQSYPQEVEVEEMRAPLKQTLKHITLLPEFIIAPSGNTISLKVFGTYHNNEVKDVTPMPNWNIGDKEVLELQESGEFLAKSQGITEVTAELDNLKSSSAKIIVVEPEKKILPSASGEIYRIGEKIYSQDLARDIKTDVERVRKSFVEEGRRLSLIKISPDYLRIPLGENGQLTALGVYTDNSEKNLTLLGKWASSDNRIATVYKGKVSTFSMGEAKIHVRYQGRESMPALVIVEEPKLVSIILSPQNSQISMKDKLNLKAEGYFSDSSRKDITSLVTWEITAPRVIKIEKGTVRPLRIGETQVYAEYSGIKSLPANIKVIFTIQWLLEMIFIIISFLILSIIILFSVLYFITEHEKNKLLSLYKNPRDFIISVYDNVKRILIIFGLRYEGFLPPLSYAQLVEKRYSIRDNIFLRFTVKFEEAKYSQHILQSNDAHLALDEYNNFLKILFSRQHRSSLLLRHCLALLHRRPLFINKSSFTNF